MLNKNLLLFLLVPFGVLQGQSKASRLRYIVHALQVATRVDTLEPEQNDSVFSLTFSRKNMWRRGLLYQGAEPNDVAFLLYRTLK